MMLINQLRFYSSKTTSGKRIIRFPCSDVVFESLFNDSESLFNDSRRRKLGLYDNRREKKRGWVEVQERGHYLLNAFDTVGCAVTQLRCKLTASNDRRSLDVAALQSALNRETTRRRETVKKHVSPKKCNKYGMLQNLRLFKSSTCINVELHKRKQISKQLAIEPRRLL
jgi:hypothetical protein